MRLQAALSASLFAPASARSGESPGSDENEGSADQRSLQKPQADAVPGFQRQCIGTAEDESELRQFLKVVRPDWSCPRMHGRSDVNRVLEKLKAIGVSDTKELMRRVNRNKINEDFLIAGKTRFSQETMDAFRKQSSFVRALDHLKEPYVRQIGSFAPVPQLLTGTNLRLKEKRESPQPVYDDASVLRDPPADLRPSSEPGCSRQTLQRATMYASGRSGSTVEVAKQAAVESRRRGALDLSSELDLEQEEGAASRSASRGKGCSVGLGDLGGTLDMTSLDGHLASLQASVCSSGGGSLILDDSDGEPWALHRPSALYLRGARPRHRQPDMTQAPGLVYSLTDLRLQEGSTYCGQGRHGSQTPSRSSRAHSPSHHGAGQRTGDLCAPLSPDSSLGGASSIALSRALRGNADKQEAWTSSSAFPVRPRRASDSSTFASNMSVATGRERSFKHAPSDQDEKDETDREEELEAYVDFYNKQGPDMAKGLRDARWAHRAQDPDAAIHQCEAMLQEQAALDERKLLEKEMRMEGAHSPLRRYVVKNIRKLLRTEKDRDLQGALDTQQRATNIRKHLAHMQSKRRDLAMLQARAKEAVLGKVDDKPTMSKPLETSLVEKFRKARSKTMIPPPEDFLIEEPSSDLLTKSDTLQSKGDGSPSRRGSQKRSSTLQREISSRLMAGRRSVAKAN
mmetsp:Transcript_100552/g.192781  ORF Transcript_100552/g.192781 Transcript_100552/m.192781 type:complete len:683 (-) Transcript_100552:64-2112(-)